MKKLAVLALALPALSLVPAAVAANDGGYSGWHLCADGFYLIWIGWWHYTGIPC